ncbi:MULTISPECIES: hypothetical protein [unclassified Methanoculleus]|nr:MULTISPECIES: hypothetical protein [unclassified Methanoculleus]MDD2253049.1 hypothetical protein [Methanoculleus sp.]MDD2786645.1 hypothetical protein [Methanoculleus sp.]MDD3217338.1 hypothetical protein [Methanoculleus sp.]MDD4313895.1 hypothetical protein [Methanoculleus sp.]HOI59188.1 hypothetical protein [Methanoculleus sp.]
MEKILSEMPLQDPKIIGFTIISGSPEGAPYLDSSEESEESDVEVVEGDDCIYVTAVADARASGAPYVTFQEDSVTLCVGGDEETIIDLDCEIDVLHSSYNVQHGVIDAVCRKKSTPDEIARS